MNFQRHQPPVPVAADGEEEESGKEGGHVHVTESRRRTRTRSDDSSRNDGSADEESVDHVSALLMSRGSRQRHGDPPIVECDTSFDDDKQQNNRLTREEFDDDCWGADLSDEDFGQEGDFHCGYNNNASSSSINIQNLNHRQQQRHHQQCDASPPSLLSTTTKAATTTSDRMIIRQLTAKSKKKLFQTISSSSFSSSSGLLFSDDDDDDGDYDNNDDDDENSSIVASSNGISGSGGGINCVNSLSTLAVSSTSSVSSAMAAMQQFTTTTTFRPSPSTSTQPQQQRRQPKTTSSSSPKSASSSINSLPTRPTCTNFPDESDRKRIVGCLAAILSCSYTHETAPHLLVKKKQSQHYQEKLYHHYNHHYNSQQQQRYYEQQQQQRHQQKRDVSINDSSRSSDGVSRAAHRTSVVRSISSPPPQSSSSMKHKEDDFPPCSSSIMRKPQYHQQQRVGNNHPLSFDNDDVTTPSNWNNHVHLQPDKQQQQIIRQRSYSNGNATTNTPMTTTTTTSSLHQTFTSSINNSLQKASSVGVSSTQPSTKLKDELAEIRHRIRRHAIYSDLLVSSADLLMLDSSHAKAFLPMLEGLLTKVEVDDIVRGFGGGDMGAGSMHGGARQSWKGRGFGGGGVVDPCLSMQQRKQEQQPNVRREVDEVSLTPLSLSNNVHSNIVEERARSRMQQRDSTTRPLKGAADNNMSMSYEDEKESAIHVGHEYLYESSPSSSLTAVETSTKKSHPLSSPSPPPLATPSTPPHDAPMDAVMVDKDIIAPFLQTLTPGAGFRCIALLLLNHLLRDGRGYDARVRQAFKRLAVVVLSHELQVGGILRVDSDDDDVYSSMPPQQQQKNNEEGVVLDDADELARLATRKFEAMEHAIAAKLIAMSGETTTTQSGSGKDPQKSSRAQSRSAPSSANPTPNCSTHGGRIALAPKETPLSSEYGISKEQLLRGIKVGTAGAVGATLFALTGGLAAPGIAAGLAAVAGGSALAAGVTTVLSSAAAITTIFGVGGAGLAGYKMHRRTKGLTEFDFHKEQLGKNSEAELFSTVCISGWLRDARDFQRPWGVTPTHPRIVDKQELLERFYFIHNPDNVHRVAEILKHWKGRYFQLWRALHEKYGSDPSNLFPLKSGPRISAELTHEESLAVDFLMDELGYSPKKKSPSNEKESHFFGMSPSNSEAMENEASLTGTRPPKSSPPKDSKKFQSAQKQLKDSSLKQKKGLFESIGVNSSELASSLSFFLESETNSINDNSTHTAGSSIPDTSSSSRGPSPRPAPNTDAAGVKPPPKHLLTVWDYHANYGGELYTVRWESDLLMELCDSVADQMIEWGVSATKTILHTTVFATLMTAVTLPYSLVLAANAIDSSWTMATERADRAGVELAKNLIDSNAGHRPVVLVGFSMGARVIYSCLKELSRHQEIWEDHQQKKRLPLSKRKQKDNNFNQGEDKLKYIREPASIVEDAVLMGTPNHISLKSWEACRRVVAGRLVNCYSRKDLILSLMFQMKKFQGILRAICGTSPVTVNGVENYDVTDLVTGHTDYCLMSGEILKRVRHGEPQRASVSNSSEVMAMVTTIKVANNDISFASLADETTERVGSKKEK